MNYIKKLNLPSTPLRDGAINELTALKKEFKKSTTSSRVSGWNPHVVTEVDQFLSYELLDILRPFGLTPSYLVNFGQLDRLHWITPIHTDISPIEGNKKVTFAINWELTSTKSQWNWWDTANATVMVPSTGMETITRQKLGGLRYVNFEEFDQSIVDKYGFKILESYRVLPHTAYLLRTDLPHNIEYHNPTPERVSISVRFDTATILTWEDTIKLFEPLIVE